MRTTCAPHAHDVRITCLSCALNMPMTCSSSAQQVRITCSVTCPSFASNQCITCASHAHYTPSTRSLHYHQMLITPCHCAHCLNLTFLQDLAILGCVERNLEQSNRDLLLLILRQSVCADCPTKKKKRKWPELEHGPGFEGERLRVRVRKAKILT